MRLTGACLATLTRYRPTTTCFAPFLVPGVFFFQERHGEGGRLELARGEQTLKRMPARRDTQPPRCTDTDIYISIYIYIYIYPYSEQKPSRRQVDPGATSPPASGFPSLGTHHSGVKRLGLEGIRAQPVQRRRHFSNGQPCVMGISLPQSCVHKCAGICRVRATRRPPSACV